MRENANSTPSIFLLSLLTQLYSRRTQPCGSGKWGPVLVAGSSTLCCAAPSYPGYPVSDTEDDPGRPGSALQAQMETCGLLSQIHPTLMLSNSDDLSGPWLCLPAKPWLSRVRLYPLGYYRMLTKSPPWQVLWFSPQDQYIPPRNMSKLPFPIRWEPRISQAFSLPKPLSCCSYYAAANLSYHRATLPCRLPRIPRALSPKTLLVLAKMSTITPKTQSLNSDFGDRATYIYTLTALPLYLPSFP